MKLQSSLLIALTVAACAGGDRTAVAANAATPTDAARDTAVTDAHTTTDSAAGTVTRDAAITPPRGPSIATFTTGDSAAPVVKGLYVNRFAAQSTRRMRQIIAMADSTEVNALVIDIKDEFGLNYAPSNPEFAKNAGNMGKIANLRGLLDTLRAHKILPIARIVVFKDSVTARVHPEWTIRQADGSIWRDHKGLAWVNPYHRELWDYNIGVAEELIRLGFGEIQFDYIRFPEPYKSLPPQVFSGSKGQSKPDAIAEFLKTANARLDKLGARTTADIFGLVTTVGGPLEVAQHWERLAPVTDVLLPMVYPSHYPRGSFGIPVPNADPYKTILTAISRARERDKKLGITTPEHVRPWLQAFTLGKPEYGAEQIQAQK